MLIMTNVDNINADQVPYLIEQILEKGAKNVHVVNAMTKKGRQEYIIFVDAPQEIIPVIRRYLASEIGTLGIRIVHTEHMAYEYFFKTIQIKLKDTEKNILWEGSVRVKVLQDENSSPLSARIEYEDLKKTAKALEQTGSGVTFHELKQLIEIEVLQTLKKSEIKVEFELL